MGLLAWQKARRVLEPNACLAPVFVIPAERQELTMVGYLLVIGVKTKTPNDEGIFATA